MDERQKSEDESEIKYASIEVVRSVMAVVLTFGFGAVVFCFMNGFGRVLLCGAYFIGGILWIQDRKSKKRTPQERNQSASTQMNSNRGAFTLLGANFFLLLLDAYILSGFEGLQGRYIHKYFYCVGFLLLWFVPFLIDLRVRKTEVSWLLLIILTIVMLWATILCIAGAGLSAL